MGKSVRIWQKKQLRLDHLTFRQKDMVQIGSAGLLSVFKRLAAAQGPNDTAAKPLSKRYAIYKTRKGLGNRRNLKFTGQLLRSLKLRTVSENRAYAAPDASRRLLLQSASPGSGWQHKMKSTVTNRDVARGNQRREPWLVFSPANQKAVMEKAGRIFAQAAARIVRWGNLG